MRLLTIGAGFAIGYVLGTRAGREKYEQIVASTRRLRENPTAGQAVQAAQELLTAPPAPSDPTAPPKSGASAAGTKTRSRRSSATTPSAADAPA